MPASSIGMADPLKGYQYQDFGAPTRKPMRQAETTPLVSAPTVSTPLANAEPTAPTKTFYQDRKRGWFWYEDPPKKSEEEPAKPPPPPQQQPEQAKESHHRIPNMDDYTLEQLWNMHPDDFQPLLLDFAKVAVMKPTEKNVTAYMTMVDIARRKAAAFSQATVFVTTSNSAFNVLRRDIPSSPVARKSFVQQRNRAVGASLRTSAGTYGLLYFYSPTCKYCAAFEPVLARFQRETGWEIKPINVDSNPPIKTALGVTTTPTVILISSASQQSFPIAVGVATVSEMKNTAYRAIRYLEGDTTPGNFSIYPFEEGGGLDPESIFQRPPMEAYYRRHPEQQHVDQ